MIRWIPYTFVRTVLFFAGGILLGMYAPDLIPETSWLPVAGCGVLAYFLVVFLRTRPFLNPGWIGLPLVFLLGYVHVVGHTESRARQHLLHAPAPVTHYQAVVTRYAEERNNSWKVEAKVLQVHAGAWQSFQGKVMLYFSRRDFAKPFQYGDVLLISGQPELQPGPANPGEFDYREYLALRNIYHVHFLKKGEALKTGYDPPSAVMALAYRGREWSQATLRKFVHGKREQAIASALVLGVTDGLDNDLLNAYAATGSMHILAVSGLHISILYFILLWVLSPLTRLPGGRWFVPIAGLLIMWMYAFVTGLSPSVLRAVVMFSFLSVARTWARNTNVYNTLAVSAFCLLLYDPFLLRSVGFQLSYLAVLGIVYLYPKILVLWEPRTWLVTEVWRILAVSIAAQAATFSLGLLYFHQFPNLFLLSNLLVVPVSSLVLIFGVVVLGVSFAPMLAVAAGFCLEMLIKFLNYIVFTLESIPFGLVGNVYISALQCALLLLFVVAILALIHYKKFGYVVLSFFVILLFSSLQWLHFTRDVDVSKIAVYNIPGHSVVDLIDRGHAFFLADPVIRADDRKIRYHVSPNRLMAGVERVSTGFPVSRALKGCEVLAWNGKTILHITDKEFAVPANLSVDLVIIANNAVEDAGELIRAATIRKVVLDSSNSFFFASRFLEAAKLYKLEVYSVLHQGAFISTIENHDS
ncbi:MAG TPA: ComEC/Rec2 family competence protein [Chryseosolibacter sp.]